MTVSETAKDFLPLFHHLFLSSQSIIETDQKSLGFQLSFVANDRRARSKKKTKKKKKNNKRTRFIRSTRSLGTPDYIGREIKFEIIFIILFRDLR